MSLQRPPIFSPRAPFASSMTCLPSMSLGYLLLYLCCTSSIASSTSPRFMQKEF